MTDRTALDRSALDTVQAQLDAFNAHDLEAFVATYADHAVGTAAAPEPPVGPAAIRAFYEPRLPRCSRPDPLRIARLAALPAEMGPFRRFESCQWCSGSTGDDQPGSRPRWAARETEAEP